MQCSPCVSYPDFYCMSVRTFSTVLSTFKNLKNLQELDPGEEVGDTLVVKIATVVSGDRFSLTIRVRTPLNDNHRAY